MELVDPLIGRELGNYRLERRLGQGSCGVVYLGEHVKLGTPFAVKILHPILAKNEESAERFLREAQTAARLNHENIVFIADFDVEPGIGPFFIMEFLDGKSLREVLDQDAPFPSERIATICEQICLPLAVAHRNGVIHRDLKPENIVLLPRAGGGDRVKILDFGIAKITRDNFPEARDLTRSGRVLGTPRYFSPEQAQGRGIDHRSDIYSFGIILYEMLTGKAPFNGNTPEEMVLQHLTQPPPPLDPTKFPSELEDLLNWMLAKKPTERPDDMDEVWALLAEALPQIAEPGETLPPRNAKSKTTGKGSSPPNGQAHIEVASQLNQTTGYTESSSSLSALDNRVNETIPLGTDPNRLSQLPGLSPAEQNFLDQESTLHERATPEMLRKLLPPSLSQETSDTDYGQQSLPSVPPTVNVEQVTRKERPPPSVLIDPSLPSEFFADEDEDLGDTAIFADDTKAAVAKAKEEALNNETSTSEENPPSSAHESKWLRTGERAKPVQPLPANGKAPSPTGTAGYEPLPQTIPVVVSQPPVALSQQPVTSSETQHFHPFSRDEEENTAETEGKTERGAVPKIVAVAPPLSSEMLPEGDTQQNQIEHSLSLPDISHLPPPPLVEEPLSAMDLQADTVQRPAPRRTTEDPPSFQQGEEQFDHTLNQRSVSSELEEPPTQAGFAQAGIATPHIASSYPQDQTTQPSQASAHSLTPGMNQHSPAHAPSSPSLPTLGLPSGQPSNLAFPPDNGSLAPFPPSPSTSGSYPSTQHTESSAPQSHIPPGPAQVDALLDDSPLLISSKGSFLSPSEHPLRFAALCLGVGVLAWWMFSLLFSGSNNSIAQKNNTSMYPCIARVRIQTTPSNAELWYKNQRLGFTPYLFRDQCNKRVVLEFRHLRSGKLTQMVQLNEGESEVTFPLQRKVVRQRPVPRVRPKVQRRLRRRRHRRSRRRRRRLHSLMVYAYPSAHIYWGRRYVCKTPCRLRGRKHSRRRYTLRRRGYRTRRILVRFHPRRRRYRFRLRRR